MIYVNILFCFIALLASIILNKGKKGICPTTIFWGLWFLIFLLSSFGLYGLHRPSDKSLVILLTMCCSVFFGEIVGGTSREKKKQKTVDYSVKWSIFWVLITLSMLFDLIDIFQIVKYTSQGTPLWQVRNWLLQPFGSNNPILNRRSFIEELVRTVIISPINSLFIPVASFTFFNTKQKSLKKKMIVLLVTKSLLSSISGGGGRMSFAVLVFCIITSYKASSISDETKKRIKKVLAPIIVLTIAGSIIATRARVGSGDIFRQFYSYFAIQPTLFSEWLPIINNSPKTLGLTTLFGVHAYVFRAFSLLGFGLPSIYTVSYQNILNAELFRPIGVGIRNAFVTPAYYFMCDGGIIAVIVFSALLGWTTARSYINYQRQDNLKGYLYYYMSAIIMLLTFMRIQTAIPSFIISLLLIPVIIKRDQNDEKRKN